MGLISTFKITEYPFRPEIVVRLHREVCVELKDLLFIMMGRVLVGRPKDETRHLLLIVAAMETESPEKARPFGPSKGPSSSWGQA